MLERDKNGQPKETQKPIASVQKGDLVYSYDEQTGQMGWYPVTETLVHTDEVIVYVALQIGLEHNEIISTTPQHPFYVTKRASLETLEKRNLSKALENLSNKWIPASDLEVGDEVLTSSGQVGRVTLVRAFEKTQEMYNLEVARAETFTVGSRGWVVHNADSPELYRGDSRDISDILKEGFKPWGGTRDPLEHVGGEKSDFVSTTDSMGRAKTEYGPNGNVYKIRP